MGAYPIISADTHLLEPLDLWETRLPKGMRDRAARLVWKDQNMHFVGAGGIEIITLSEYRDETGRPLEMSSTVETRERDMDIDGVWAEVVHPNVGLLSFCSDHELAMAHARVYNNYLIELFGGHFDRHRPTAVVPMTDVDDAVAEIERVAAMGLRGIILPVEAPQRYFSPVYDRVWSAAQAHGLAVAFHIGVRTVDPDHPSVDMVEVIKRLAGSMSPDDPAAHANRLTTQREQSFGAQIVIADLVGGGVTERFPDLHFMFVEFNANWLAGLMGAFDKAYTLGIGGQELAVDYAEQGAYDHARNRDDQPLMVKRFAMNDSWPYPLRPSEYIRRQIHCSFQEDPAAIALRHFTGVDCLIWGSDYPHQEGSWPRSVRSIDAQFAGVPDEERGLMTGGTLAKLFGFDAPPTTTMPEALA